MDRSISQYTKEELRRKTRSHNRQKINDAFFAIDVEDVLFEDKKQRFSDYWHWD